MNDIARAVLRRAARLLVRAGLFAPVASWVRGGRIAGGFVYPQNRDLVDHAARSLHARRSAHRFARICGAGDGGYVVAVDLPSCSTVLSIGVGDNDRADVELTNQGAKVFQFDHTIARSPSAAEPGIKFHSVGLGSTADAPPLITLDAMFEHFVGPVEPDGCWLTLDAEGAEWAALAERPPAIDRFAQVVVELHGLIGRMMSTDPDLQAETFAAVDALTRNHVPIAVHANNCCPMVRLFGTPVPEVLEVTLVRRDLFRPGDSSPSPDLFEPNLPDRADHPQSKVFRQRARVT
jgi:hypothetical protein